MFTTNYSADTEASPEQVWAAIQSLHSGTRLSERSDAFELHGPFALGTELSVTPQGQGTFRSKIVEFVEHRVYADRTEYEGLTLLFRHTLSPNGQGTTVTHELVIDGPGVAEVGPIVGSQISADFPVAMADLMAAAARVDVLAGQ
jgi:Polyketide cyclase / dehydrase and lipid transport